MLSVHKDVLAVLSCQGHALWWLAVMHPLARAAAIAGEQHTFNKPSHGEPLALQAQKAQLGSPPCCLCHAWCTSPQQKLIALGKSSSSCFATLYSFKKEETARAAGKQGLISAVLKVLGKVVEAVLLCRGGGENMAKQRLLAAPQGNFLFS